MDRFFPGTGNHGELAGVGAMFCTYLRGDTDRLAQLDRCLRRHDLPRTAADLGLSREQFTTAVLAAPATRPDRYTILEHLNLTPGEIRARVEDYEASYG